MDLDRLHEFERIASCGSVSAAAHELGLSVVRALRKALASRFLTGRGGPLC